MYWVREKSIKIQQIDYTSVEKICFSDHKPVCSTFILVVKRIDEKKRNIVYEEVLRETDKRVNELLPAISLSKTEVNFFKILIRTIITMNDKFGTWDILVLDD